MSYQLHSATDLRAASMVWLSRRKAMEAMLIAERPWMQAGDIKNLVSDCFLYSTCNDQLFADAVSTSQLEVA